MQAVDLMIDVTEAAGLGEEAFVALTVHLPAPETLLAERVVCFAKPGGGYSRGYYTIDLPGPAKGAQAEWHANRGWVFVSVDHLGVGDSSTHHDPNRLDYTTVAAASQAAEQEVLARLAKGAVLDGYPAVSDPLLLGIGQSMGGCLTVIQQGRFHCYDGIGVLGYGAIHTHPPVTPGQPELVFPWRPRDTLHDDPMVIVNGPQLAAAEPPGADSWARMTWGFHYADVDDATIAADMHRGETWPGWASRTSPAGVASSCLTPGAIAPEAAAVVAPVLVAMGERDVIADPRGEPRAYLSAKSVDLFVCPRMGHMHNFASTREMFWQRIETWAAWVATVKDARLL